MDTVEEIYDSLIREISYVRSIVKHHTEKSCIDTISKGCHEMFVMHLNQRDEIANLKARIELLVNVDAER